jgi:hypothetical protein
MATKSEQDNYTGLKRSVTQLSQPDTLHAPVGHRNGRRGIHASPESLSSRAWNRPKYKAKESRTSYLSAHPAPAVKRAQQRGVFPASSSDLVCAPFNISANDLLVFRTEDPASPAPYYLGCTSASRPCSRVAEGLGINWDGEMSKKPRDSTPTLAVHWLLPQFKQKDSDKLLMLPGIHSAAIPIAQQWMDGSRVLMRFDDGKWYHGTVSKCRATRRTCTIDFDDGDHQRHVSFDDPDVMLVMQYPAGERFPAVNSTRDWDLAALGPVDSKGYNYQLPFNIKPEIVRQDCLLCRLRVLHKGEIASRQVLPLFAAATLLRDRR